MTPSPAPASTVVVLRGFADRTRGFEVYLLRREPGAAFLADACVFPGGRVDAHVDAAIAASFLDEATALPVPAPASREHYALHLAAALRELFEEAGLLLAETPDGDPVALDGDASRLMAMRNGVAAGAHRLDEACAALGCRLQPARLVPHARWITPPGEPRRFDTWVFLAEAPGRQSPSPDGDETLVGVWLTPADALARAEAGEIVLAPPTAHTLEDLSTYASVDDVLAAARRSTPLTFAPQPVTDAEGEWMVLPGDPLYPDAGADEPWAGRAAGPTRFRRVGTRWQAVAPVTIAPRGPTLS